jgi:hypothetical protein
MVLVSEMARSDNSIKHSMRMRVEVELRETLI